MRSVYLSTLLVLFFSSGLMAATSSQHVEIAESLLRPPEFALGSLSPNGKMIALVLDKGDRDAISVINIETHTSLYNWTYEKYTRIPTIHWAGDERIVAKVGLIAFVAQDIDGKNSRKLGDLLRILPSNDVSNGKLRIIKENTLGIIDTRTGEFVAEFDVPVGVRDVIFDDKGTPIYCVGSDKSGTYSYQWDGGWRERSNASSKEFSAQVIGFDSTTGEVVLEVNDHGEPSRVIGYDPTNHSERIISVDSHVDPSHYFWASDHRTLLAVAYEPDRSSYDIVNSTHPEALQFKNILASFPNDSVQIVNTSRDGVRTLVNVWSDTNPGDLYVFDRAAVSLTKIVSARPWIDNKSLPSTVPVRFLSSDQVPILAYLTLPRAEPKSTERPPLVLLVNNWTANIGIFDELQERQYSIFDEHAKFLASRGYAVLRINHRGRHGFGEKFILDATTELVVDDVIYGLDYLSEKGVIDSSRVCILSSSESVGLAILAATRKGDVRCIVAIGTYFTVESVRSFDRRIWRRNAGVTEVEVAKAASDVLTEIDFPILAVNQQNDKFGEDSFYGAFSKIPGLTFFHVPNMLKYELRVKIYKKVTEFLAINLGSAQVEGQQPSTTPLMR